MDKKYAEGLSPREEAELDRLQEELAAHQQLVSPRAVVILPLLEGALQQRAINTNAEVAEVQRTAGRSEPCLKA